METESYRERPDFATKENAVEKARAAFPNGLEQPAESYRFSRDALFLAEFAHECFCGPFVVDLGTGCGAAALALLLRSPSCYAIGLEIQEPLVIAARRNVEKLGLESRMRILQGDVEDKAFLKYARQFFADFQPVPPQVLPQADMVICNPPWRRHGSGRLPPSELRRKALFGTDKTFSVFFNAADALLKNRGRLIAVASASQTTALLAALPSRLQAERLRYVFSGNEAVFVLLCAVKQGEKKGGIREVKVDRISC